MPSENPSKKALPLKNLLRTLLRSVRLHDPLGVRPNQKIVLADVSQARKKNSDPNWLVRISSGGVGVFHVKGWGSKGSVCPSNPKETKLFGGISRGFARDIPGVPEKFEKKKFVFNFWPLVSDILYFFGRFGGGDKEGSVRAGGGWFFTENKGGRVFAEEGGGEQVLRGCLQGGGEGGLIFFFGAEMPTKLF